MDERDENSYFLSYFLFLQRASGESGSGRSVKKDRGEGGYRFNTWDNVFFFVVLQQLNKIERRIQKVDCRLYSQHQMKDQVCTVCILLLNAAVSDFGAYQERQCCGELEVRDRREALKEVKPGAPDAERSYISRI